MNAGIIDGVFALVAIFFEDCADLMEMVFTALNMDNVVSLLITLTTGDRVMTKMSYSALIKKAQANVTRDISWLACTGEPAINSTALKSFDAAKCFQVNIYVTAIIHERLHFLHPPTRTDPDSLKGGGLVTDYLLKN